MEAKATAKHVRMAPRKVRFVMDSIRGKYADDALNQLRFTPNHAADEIANVLRSAMANAEANHGMKTDYLKIARCFVDVGPTAKRVQPRAQGRAYRILKRSSHITIVVEEAEAPPTTRQREIEIKRRGKKAPLQAPLPGGAVAALEATSAPVDGNVDETTNAVPVAEATTPATENVVAEENAMGSDETTPLPSDLPTGQPQAEAAVDAAAGSSNDEANKE